MERGYKIVVYTPESHTEKLLKIMMDSGAGKVGEYSHCTFTMKGVGRSGEALERIETYCTEENLYPVLKAIKENHPDGEATIDFYEIEVFK